MFLTLQPNLRISFYFAKFTLVEYIEHRLRVHLFVDKPVWKEGSAQTI